MASKDQGVGMRSSVLSRKISIEGNIQITRVFSKMREMILNNKKILLKLKQVEKNSIMPYSKMKKYDRDIQVIFAALQQ